MIIPMTAHCHTHSCACASMSDSIELRYASDKSQGSPSSSGREAFSLGHAVPFKYENVPAELSMTDTKSITFSLQGCPNRISPDKTCLLVLRRLELYGPQRGLTVNIERPG